MGLEPTTATLATWRSTTELHPLDGENIVSPSTRIIKLPSPISRGKFHPATCSTGATIPKSHRVDGALPKGKNHRPVDPQTSAVSFADVFRAAGCRQAGDR